MGKIVRRFASYLMPMEWALVAGGILTWWLYYYFELLMPGEPGRNGPKGPMLFYLKQIYTSLYLYALMFVLYVIFNVGLALYRAGGQPGKVSWRETWSRILARFYPAQFLQDARFFHAVLLMFVEFQLLKNLIPHVHPGTFDSEFIASEQLLCGGRLCAQVLHDLIGTGFVAAIGAHYHWYFPYMIGTVVIFIGAAERKLAQEYLCAFVLLFLIGILWVYAVPTWGPVYATPELFSFVRDSEIGALQHDLWSMKEALDLNPHDRQAIYTISGFPSLHVAVVLLGSLYLRKINYYLSLTSWSFLLLIINSTIYLGWHYVLDDLGSIALVGVCVYIARRATWEWRPAWEIPKE